MTKNEECQIQICKFNGNFSSSIINFYNRVICVSSSMQYAAQLNTDDLMMENSSMGFLNYVPYSNSKMANALFTREFAKRLDGCDTNIKTYSLCPGIVHTDVFRHDNWYKRILTGISLATAGFSVKEVNKMIKNMLK